MMLTVWLLYYLLLRPRLEIARSRFAATLRASLAALQGDNDAADSRLGTMHRGFG